MDIVFSGGTISPLHKPFRKARLMTEQSNFSLNSLDTPHGTASASKPVAEPGPANPFADISTPRMRKGLKKSVRKAHEDEDFPLAKKRVGELLALDPKNQDYLKLRDLIQSPLDTFRMGTQSGERMVKTVDGIEYAFRWCPAGTFTMGSPEDEPNRTLDETQHTVTLTRGFWMLETQVTQAMWQSVMGTNPSCFKGAKNPVECVNWDDCQSFCGQLSSKLGLTASLPTEAQWEYACRAGTTTAYSFGDSLNGREANCDGNYPDGTETEGPYLEKTVPVRSYAPNAWGLYDMHGNVLEWCQDRYDKNYYAESPASDPKGPNRGSCRVFRGGDWSSDAEDCRSANRCGDTPDYRDDDLGFRIVLAEPTPKNQRAA